MPAPGPWTISPHNAGALVFTVAVLLCALPGVALGDISGGMEILDEPDHTPTEGCSCHAPAPNPKVGLSINVEDSSGRFRALPERYIPGNTYHLVITVQGGPAVHSEGLSSEGGFALEVSNGTLSVPEGATDVQVSGDANQWATHTESGADQRQWRVDWMAPEPALGHALFHLAALSSNGDGFHDDGDGWNRATFIVSSPSPPSDENGSEGPAETIPMNAYWFGVVAFLATLMLVWVAFAVLRAEDAVLPPVSPGGDDKRRRRR